MESISETILPVTVRRFLAVGSQRMPLELVAGERGLDRRIEEPVINRPAFALTGFYRQILPPGGAVLAGQTTASEFGGVNLTRTVLHGTTHNPWQHDRTPGGLDADGPAARAGDECGEDERRGAPDHGRGERDARPEGTEPAVRDEERVRGARRLPRGARAAEEHGGAVDGEREREAHAGGAERTSRASAAAASFGSGFTPGS